MISSMVFSQKSDFLENVRFGGGLGLSFGDVTTISVSPSAVYDFKNGFALGAGVNYAYIGAKNSSANIYGASLISLYDVPTVNIQLSGEFEQSFINRKAGTLKDSYSTPALYFGVAYRGLRGMSFGFRYDVLHSDKSIYSSAFSPIVRFYF